MDDFTWLTSEGAVRRRSSHGGTAPAEVSSQLKKARKTLSRNEQSLELRKVQVEAVYQLLS
jgi:hypothetical protein